MVRTKDTQIIGGTRVVARKTKSPKKKIVAPVPVTNKRRFRPGNLKLNLIKINCIMIYSDDAEHIDMIHCMM